MGPHDLLRFEVDRIDAAEATVITRLGTAAQPEIVTTRRDVGRVARFPAIVHAVVCQEGYVEVSGCRVERRRRPVARSGGYGADEVGPAGLRLELWFDDLSARLGLDARDQVLLAEVLGELIPPVDGAQGVKDRALAAGDHQLCGLAVEGQGDQ